MVKLVITDLDGTLLRRGKPELEKSTFELIHRLQKKGILFAAASGRQYQNMRKLFKEAGDEMYFVCENGSLILHKGEEYRRLVIEKEVSLPLIHDILQVEGAEALISGVSTYYLCPKTESFYNRMQNDVKSEVTLVQDIDQVEEDFIKVSMYMKGHETVPYEINQRFRQKYGEKLFATDSGNGWLDFVPKNSSKGSAVTYLMEKLHLKPEEIMVFGDHENDISMLVLTENSYVMAHAQDKIKQYAKHECNTVDEVLETML